MGMDANSGALTYRVISQLAGHRAGAADVACPSCGPDRRTPANQRRKVLRVWRVSPSFLTYRCARCDLHGYAREDGAPTPEPAALARAKAEAQRFAAETAEAKRSKARWLWGQRRPIIGTPAERYLREVRCYGGPIPATIGFLPARGDYTPAMISAFDMPTDIEPEVIAISPAAIQGVHLTRLVHNGSAKAGTYADKIMIGTPRGSPIALAAVGDLLGLAITEGIEDGLSVHEATGLGVWAAGSASFMPALAAAIPSYVDFVTVVADPDADGQRFAGELKAALAAWRTGCLCGAMMAGGSQHEARSERHGRCRRAASCAP
jgi:Toprim domain